MIIGDEMGLGKTVEALAVLAHLAARPDESVAASGRFLVICPAAVVSNWVRETEEKTTLTARRLHGPTRLPELWRWLDEGGVAVTTFESLAWFGTHTEPGLDLACVIVDEAHYVKNPDAKRSQRVAALLGSSRRTVLMTGTPLENRVDEFRVLAGYVRPDLQLDGFDENAASFRHRIAPAYLRRNQEDVLTELPDLVEKDNWTVMAEEERSLYRVAVAAGAFHDMRQVAMLGGSDSSKIRRLRAIIADAHANGRKTIVFSHYRAVLHAAAVHVVDAEVFGPLSGSTPAEERQRMVDAFSAAPAGAVLVAQILAGGVGLNIQAASVVVICEPQLKPTTEWQAIARSRRMGQLESVQVHRLLSEDSVDESLRRLLARKSAIFAEFAAVSETAGASPEALDVSEPQLIKEALAMERERLAAVRPPQSPVDLDDDTSDEPQVAAAPEG